MAGKGQILKGNRCNRTTRSSTQPRPAVCRWKAGPTSKKSLPLYSHSGGQKDKILLSFLLFANGTVTPPFLSVRQKFRPWRAPYLFLTASYFSFPFSFFKKHFSFWILLLSIQFSHPPVPPPSALWQSLNSRNATVMKRASVLVKLWSHLSSCIVSAMQAIPGKAWISVYTIFPEKSFAVATVIVFLNEVETVPELSRVVSDLTVHFSAKYSSTGTSDKDTNDMSPKSAKLSIICSISSCGDKRWPFSWLLRYEILERLTKWSNFSLR